MSAKELVKRATLRSGLRRKLAPILESSGCWGRIKAEIVCSMTSKCASRCSSSFKLRANTEKCVETLPIDRFRELLGVYSKLTYKDLQEVGNNLSSMPIKMSL